MRDSLKHLALALTLGAGLGAGSAPAQTIIEVGGDGTIGTETLTVNSLDAAGDTFKADGGVGTVYSDLVSPAATVGATGAVTLTFDHRYNFEGDGWDGGALYVSVNGGPETYVEDAAFTSGGYDAFGHPDSSAWPITTKLFNGQSTGFGTPAYVTSVVNLGSLNSGDTVSVIFRGGWDAGFVQEPAPNWEVSTVKLTDSAATDILDVDFTPDGTAGFTVENIGPPAGPWIYAKPVHTFEIDAALDTSDQYAPTVAGAAIDLNGAVLAVELVDGDLAVGDTFTLFDLSGGTNLTGTIESISLPPGTWDTSNVTTTGTIEMLVLPPLLAEPFDYPTANLNGQDGGVGFTGVWDQKKRNGVVVEGNLFWGALDTTGNSLRSNAWSSLTRPIGTTLLDEGLLDDGATLWFSYVMDITGQNLTNLDYNFCLGTDDFGGDPYADRNNLIAGEGIGVSNFRPDIKGAYWQDNDADTVAEVTREDTTLTLNNSTNARALIVGKIEWGADGTAAEKLTLYAPDADLNLGTPFLDAWETPALTQSAFDTVNIQWKDSQAMMDEIRFGATSTDVLPVELTPPALTSTVPENGDPQASGVYFVATFDAPIVIDTGNITITDQAGPTVLTTIPVTDAAQVALSDDGFSLIITPTAIPTPGNTYDVEIDAGTVTDFAGNPFGGVSAGTWSFTASNTAPMVTSIENVPAADPIYGQPVIPYTVSFDKFYVDDTTVTDADFANAGTATIGIGTVTRISGPLEPAVYTFDVTPSSFGTVELQVTGTITDRLGNPLTVPVNDDNVLTLDAGPEPTKDTITVDSSASFQPTSAFNGATFDASASDKLVVVVSGEHNFNQSGSGQINGVTYDGVDLIEAVDIDPDSRYESGVKHGDTTSGIWYLDDPGDVHVSGALSASVAGNGNNYVYTVIALSGTEPGVGAVNTAARTSAVSLIVSSPNSLMVSAVGMGGSGNSATPLPGVAADSPTGAVTIPGLEAGGNWAGHATATSIGLAADLHVFSFDTTRDDVVTIAAEFIAAEPELTDYDIWAALYPGEDLADPDADLDGDGVSNDNERVFGLDPTDPTSRDPISVALDPDAGTFSFTRRDDALTGLFSGVETSTDLVNWSRDNGAVLVAGAPVDDVETVAVTLSASLLDEDMLFVRAVQDNGVLFSVDFEADNGGFMIADPNLGTGTEWSWGAPNSSDQGGGEVTEGNGGSTNCWGTNLTGTYAAGTDASLRSPVIDLTGVTSAELSFALSIDAQTGHTYEVNVLEETTDTVLASIIAATQDPAITASSWQMIDGNAIPAAALGQKVRIEWRFIGNGDGTFNGAYIDDVVVSLSMP